VEFYHVAFSFTFLVLSIEQGGWLVLFMQWRFGCLSHNFTCQIKKNGSKAIYIVCFKGLFKIVIYCIFSHFCSMKWSWITKTAKRLPSKWSSFRNRNNKIVLVPLWKVFLNYQMMSPFLSNFKPLPIWRYSDVFSQPPLSWRF